MRHSQKPRSLGEMISTFVFLGMSVKLGLEALAWQDGVIGQGLLWLSSAACFLAVFRFRIQALADRLRE